jgi:hypothetical protein
MRAKHLIPIAVLASAVACSDTATSPTSAGGPMFLVAAGTYGTGALTNTTIAALPSGGHLQSGTVFCVVDQFLVVTCSTANYTINGIGNTNADAHLDATYEATVDCTNHGGNLVEVKSQAEGAGATDATFKSKNGSLTVTPISAQTPTDQAFKNAATCPNGNWTKSLAGGSATLVSFTYTLTFAGFSTPTVDIAAP